MLRQTVSVLARPWTLATLLLFAGAFALRCWQFGNPLIHIDEDFYLLVGDRMIQGALPYVDIWDRKPIGLFMIYAAVRLLGGAGFVQYQVVATMFAAGTAVVIARIASRIAPIPAAVASGLLYLVMLGLAGGTGGQSPVFYNLFVAGAALLTLKADLATNPRAVRRLGLAAMLLAGIAIQVKYSAVFEGAFFGVVLCAAILRRRGAVRAVAPDAVLWVTVALLPTALALGFYAARGEGAAFVHANFLSIGERGGADAAELAHRLWHSLAALGPPLLAVLVSAVTRPWREPVADASFRFVLAWLGVAVAGYLAFGTFFEHYALPLMVPIAVGCAPLFSIRHRHAGAIAATVMLGAGLAGYAANVRLSQRLGGPRAMAAMRRAIDPRAGHGLYVYSGNPILYYASGTRPPTRYAFPSHLNLRREAGAIGIDPLAEIRRILALRPGLIVSDEPGDRDRSPAADAIVVAVLARDYRAVARVPYGRGITIIYARRDLP